MRAIHKTAVFCSVSSLSLWFIVWYHTQSMVTSKPTQKYVRQWIPSLAQWLIRLSAIQYFTGNRECSILQSDIYLVPYLYNQKVSPYCKNKATLLEALSGGERHGLDKPYVGRGKYVYQL
jgi:hypothetical protein